MNSALPVDLGHDHRRAAAERDPGTWTDNPTFAYQWERCDSGGAGCTAIGSATAGAYTLTASDVGHTVRVRVTATNGSGAGIATSDPTAVVQASAPPQTFGTTTIGASTSSGGANFLDVSGPYNVPTPAAVSKLTGYLAGGGQDTQMRAVIYADNSGAPGAFVGVTTAVTVFAGAAPNWVDFPFPSAVSIAPGDYWIGYWVDTPGAQVAYYDSVAGAERSAGAAYSAVDNPPDPFGSAGTSSAGTRSTRPSFRRTR